MKKGTVYNEKTFAKLVTIFLLFIIMYKIKKKIAIDFRASRGVSGTLYLQNTGYSVYNMGEISVSGGAVLNAAGTVVVNTGSMTGSGTLQLGELDDITDYDNGIEYVELGLDWSDRTPASYDRYQFVRDPAATVEVVYFIGALSNQDGGACGLTVQE